MVSSRTVLDLDDRQLEDNKIVAMTLTSTRSGLDLDLEDTGLGVDLDDLASTPVSHHVLSVMGFAEDLCDNHLSLYRLLN